MYNTAKAYEAQWEYYHKRGLPMFSPRTIWTVLSVWS